MCTKFKKWTGPELLIIKNEQLQQCINVCAHSGGTDLLGTMSIGIGGKGGFGK